MEKTGVGVFKAYDIRGIYPGELNEDLLYRIGRSFVSFLGEEKIVMGRDMRLSSPALSRAFEDGVTDQGADVVDAGLCSTDMLYFCSGKLDLPGAMFTASHNPRDYNGLKMCRRRARPISGETGIKEIEDLVLAGEFPPERQKGGVEKRDMLHAYIDHILDFIDTASIEPIKVVADAGNGMAGMTVPPVFDRLPCELVSHCFELDGSFPDHQPNPKDPRNIALLSHWVLEENGDLGIAFDGDADRVFFVDETGEPLSGSLTNAILIKHILRDNPGEKIIYNLINSWIVPETILANGGVPIRERVGHSFIKQTMMETGAIFAGEHSGHYYFRHNYNADSGLIAAMVLLQTMSVEGKPLSEILAPFKKYSDSGEINSEVKDIPRKLEKIGKKYSDGKVDHLDGVTVEYDDWWFNVRPSNTEPLLRLNVEARTPELMEEKRDELLELIRS